MRFGLISMLMLAGCAVATAPASMNRFIGKSEAELVTAMGPPRHTVSHADGSRVLEFSRGLTVEYGGQPKAAADADPNRFRTGGGDSTGAAAKPGTQALGADPFAAACAFNVTIDAQGKVQSWEASGSDCVVH